MFEYLPWSKKEQAICLNAYQMDTFTILDIELGGGCNYNCIYCDSPDRKKKCRISIKGIEQLMLQGKFRWVFICGLGEPTYKGDNYSHLLAILELCEKHGLRCSIFTNLSNLTFDLKEYIRRGVLFLLFKFDTLMADGVGSIYGTSKPSSQLAAINDLLDLVHFENGSTNIAASIVPTQLNYKEIPELVEFCKEHQIFPLIGELELSGKGEVNYNNLFLHSAQLKELKSKVEDILGSEYSIPMCPALISGIHIDNDSRVTVDSESGLSCHWFWLKEPQTETLSIISEKSSIKDITNSILEYRAKSLNNVKDFLAADSVIGEAFGGCGGDPIDVFNTYLSVSVSEQNKLGMDQIRELVNAAYNRIADKYAAAYSDNDETDFHYFDYFVRNMKGKSVLDMGCGVGCNTSLLNDRGVQVIGIDASPEMLQNARRMHPKIVFEKQDILHTSFPDNSFDGIVLSYVIEHFNDEGLRQLRSEIDRLLKDGGLLFISSHEGNGEALLADPLDETIAIYYNFLTCEALDNLFYSYDRVVFEKRASYGPDEFLSDKLFVTYRKKTKPMV